MTYLDLAAGGVPKGYNAGRRFRGLQGLVQNGHSHYQQKAQPCADDQLESQSFIGITPLRLF